MTHPQYTVRRVQLGRTAQLDELAHASGQVYSQALLFFWRTVRHKGLWLKPKHLMRLIPSDPDHLLHAHSVDAAVQAFFAGLSSWRERRTMDPNAKPPRRRKWYFKVEYKRSAMRLRESLLILSNGRENAPLVLFWEWELPQTVVIRWAGSEYEAIATYQIGQDLPEEGELTLQERRAEHSAGIDLGEVHPAVSSDGERAHLLNGRLLRSKRQYRNKLIAKLDAKISHRKKGGNIMKNITDLYLRGFSIRQIAEITGISKSTVGAIVKESGISRDRSTSQIWGCKRTTQVPFEWSFFPLTAQKAWLLGLIYGDGSLHNDGRRITITSGDRDVIDNVNHLFGGTLGIISSASTYWNIDIHSTRLWRELNSTFALVPNKSRVLRYPELSEAMHAHFIRGLLDSDGCWRSDIRNRQPKLIFQYVSLSLDFVQSLRVVLMKFVGVSPRRNVSQGRGYSLTYSNQDAVEIGHWLYADSTPQVRCERKFTYWSQFT